MPCKFQFPTYRCGTRPSHPPSRPPLGAGPLARPLTQPPPAEIPPVEHWAAALGLTLDPHQQAILDPGIRRGILNCCRKWGKSTMIALKAAHFAAHRPGTTVLVVAPSSRQSEELLGIAVRILRDLRQPATDSQTKVTLHNRSRIVALPNQPVTIRGYSPELLVIDEAAYLPDAIWETVLPMLGAAEGGGWLWLMSTPAEPIGFFHRLFTNGDRRWTRLKVTAHECSRIPAALIAEAQRSFPADRFAREYLCEFAQPPSAAFPEGIIRPCLDPTLPDFFSSTLAYPLPAAPPRAQPHHHIGQDLGQCVDRSAVAIVEFVNQPTGTIDPATRAPLFSSRLALRHLESLPLETPYPQVAARAHELVRHPRLMGRCTYIVDAHGPGGPVVDQLRLPYPKFGAPIVPMKVVTGDEARQKEKTYNVPKTLLLERLQHVLRTKKLRLYQGPLTGDLVRELTLLQRVSRPSGNVVFESPAHDDLVMALAMAVWWAWEQHAPYLQPGGSVPIVSHQGVLEYTRHHPLDGPHFGRGLSPYPPNST
jgi:hypothetical protein